MNSKRICLLGSYDELYTKMMIVELKKCSVNFDLILLKQNSAPEFKTFLERILYRLYMAVKELNKRNYKQIPRTNLFFWQTIWRRYKFLKSKKYKQIVQEDEVKKLPTVIKVKLLN